jgi:outer membrane cobalamin receptor
VLNFSIRNTIIHFNINNLIKRLTKDKENFQSNNAIFFNPSWSNKLYFKRPNEWFYKFKNKNNFQTKAQRYEHKRVVFQKHKKISEEKPNTQAQELKETYQNIFVKGSNKSQTCVFCNYYCHIGHISLDCKFRKKNNITNVVWVPKIKN